jgi:ABC-2 type transport system permease protein
VYYPVSTLPVWMRALSRALPPSYVFEGLRAIVRHQGFDASLLVIGLALSLIYIVVAAIFFRHVYRFAVRTGLLARYSAESTA